ncbi:MAG: hypothetical protein AB9869_01290 [Verrucomicrobiia bacterium]
MKTLLAFILLVASAASAAAATVTGSIYSATGSTTDGQILFRPLRPYVRGTNYITGVDRLVRTTNGVFSINLLQNDYRMIINGRSAEQIDISVPDTTSTYNFVDLITNNIVYVYLGPTVPTGGAGSVTNVAIAVGSGLAQAGSPITTGGTITLTLAADMAAIEALTGTGLLARTGVNTWVLQSTLSAAQLPTGINTTNLANGTVDNTELQYIDGLTSAVQTQLSGKSPTNHVHVIADVTSLQSTLASKSATNHVHAAADLTSGVIGTDRLPANSALNAGIVPATGGQALAFYFTDETGAPAFRTLADVILQVAGLTVTTNAQFRQVTVTGTTNQVVFAATNTAPSSPAAPTKWISVQVQGEETTYRLPLYE